MVRWTQKSSLMPDDATHIQRPQSRQPIPKSATKVFSGLRADVYQWQQKLYDGSFATFEKVARTDSVSIVAVTQDKKLLITRQLQPSWTHELFSLPGGVIDPGEDPQTAGMRELLEETGYVSDSFELFDACQPHTSTEYAIYTFLAKGCVKKSTQSLDGGEKIQLLEYTFSQFIELLYKDQFRQSDLALKLLRRLGKPGGRDALERELF